MHPGRIVSVSRGHCQPTICSLGATDARTDSPTISNVPTLPYTQRSLSDTLSPKIPPKSDKPDLSTTITNIPYTTTTSDIPSDSESDPSSPVETDGSTSGPDSSDDDYGEEEVFDDAFDKRRVESLSGSVFTVDLG